MKNRRIVIFSGYNQRAVVAFLRTLLNNNIRDYSIIAASENDTILKTLYADNVDYVRKQRKLELWEITEVMENLKEKYDVSQLLIVPSTEGLNRFLLDNIEVLSQKGCIIPLVDKNKYEVISDKEKFWKLCYKENIKVPSMVQPQQKSEIPFVAKPKKYLSSDKKAYSPVIIRNVSEYENFKNQCSNLQDFDFQKYIPGESYYLLYYFTRQQTLYKFSQKNLVQQPQGKSILLAECADIHKDAISKKYEELFLKLEYFGFVMVELRRYDNEYYMIEANPRFWGPSQLFCDAGYNFFEAFLTDYGFLDKMSSAEIDMNAKYFWSGGMLNSLENCDWHIDNQEHIKKSFDYFIRYDVYNRADTCKIYELEKSYVK